MTRLNGAFSILILASMLSVSACDRRIDVASTNNSNNENTDKKAQVSFNRFPDLPFPGTARIDMENTLIFGSGEKWFGRLTISTPYNTNEMFDYFKQEMPNFGWQEITSVRGITSTLTYSRQNRISTIQIQGTTLQGSITSIIISPEGVSTTTIPDQNGSSQIMPPPVQRGQ